MKDIKDILLGLLAVGIILIIVSPGLRHSFTAIFTVADKYGTPKLELTNNYMFTAEGISIDRDSFNNKCIVLERDKSNSMGVVYECQKGMSENFIITMKNDGYKMRTFHGGTVVCKSGDKDCCGNAKALSSAGSDDCSLVPEELKGCVAGSYTFDGTYSEYEVHPVADCIKDATYGCYDAGMTSDVESCNPNNYIIVKMVNNNPTLAPTK